MNTQNPILFYDNLWLYDDPTSFYKGLDLSNNSNNLEGIPSKDKKTKSRWLINILRIVTMFLSG